MLEDFLVNELENIPGYNKRIWFQQDGSTNTCPIPLWPRNFPWQINLEEK